ncbi:hypothetical protein D3C79_939260 [compost metagenome]
MRQAFDIFEVEELCLDAGNIVLAEIFEARHELFHFLPVELVENVGNLAVMSLDWAGITASEKIATEHIFQ